jgi:hypothetical protein
MKAIQLVGYFLVTIILATGSFFAGSYVGSQRNQTEFQRILTALPEGASVEISESDITTPYHVKDVGISVDMHSRKEYTRGMSLAGLGGPEAAAKDQGINTNNFGEDAVIGKSNYSWLAKAWDTAVKWFWGILLVLGGVGIVLAVMLFIPATSGIASTILRWIASLIPVLGSIVERIISYFHFQKPLTQVVDGGEAFKTLVNAENAFTPEVKARVLVLFAQAHDVSQDTATQTVVAKMI